MEFTGSIQFADESSWLTLTTESDDEVMITVSFNQIFGGSTEVLTFAVTPNSGIVRLPAGEILRNLINGGGSDVNGSFQASQGSSSCSHSFSVFPCRKFSYTDLYTAIFSTRPKTSPAYEGGKDTLSFFNSTMGATSAYVRFIFNDGSVSSNCKLYVPVNTRTSSLCSLDVSCDTMMSVATTNGLSASDIARYEVWIEHSGSKSEIYSFDARRLRLPLKTYKFLGRRGTYEYIHATGKFSRSIESETRVFVTSGIEQELDNDYTMNYEQNSGHVGSAGMGGFWLEFLASKERYVIEKDGSEKAIVVEEFKTSLSDRAVSSLTFKWHYANKEADNSEQTKVILRGLSVIGPDTVADIGNTARFGVMYIPSNSTTRGVKWSLIEDSNYAKIDQTGLLTVLDTTGSPVVTVVATSTSNTKIQAEKRVRILATHDPYIVFDKDTMEISATAGTVANTFKTKNLKNLSVSASGGVTLASSPVIENGCVKVSYSNNTEPFRKTCQVVMSGVRTDGQGTYSKDFLLIQAAADVESLPLRMELSTDGDTYLAYGESLDVVCTVFRGWDDVTSKVTAWKVTRDTGNEPEDTAWALKAKVKNFAGRLTITSTAEDDDLGSVGNVTKFIFTAVLSSNETASYTLELD